MILQKKNFFQPLFPNEKSIKRSQKDLLNKTNQDFVAFSIQKLEQGEVFSGESFLDTLYNIINNE